MAMCMVWQYLGGCLDKVSSVQWTKGGLGTVIDPSNGYKTAIMAAQQRPLVQEQLKALHEGEPTEEFRIVGEALMWLQERSQLATISLLDAGCASAYYYEVIEAYVPHWAEYSGIDYNDEAISMARDLYPGLPLYRGDITDPGFTTGQFDAVLTSATINHIKDWRSALRELTGICRHWLILHRLPVHDEETQVGMTEAYGEKTWDIIFNGHELAFVLAERNFHMIWETEWADLTTQVWERQPK